MLRTDSDIRRDVADELKWDPDIAHAAVEALKWNISITSDRVKVKVEHGWVTLEGDVDWYYQNHRRDQRSYRDPPRHRPVFR